MKFFALSMLVAATAAQDACACVGPEGLPESSWFVEQGYVETYGSECSLWDAEASYCAADGEYAAEAWCSAAWCYTSVDCETAEPTLFFADTEYKDTLAFSLATCAEDAEDSSSALYATAFAAAAAIAATI